MELLSVIGMLLALLLMIFISFGLPIYLLVLLIKHLKKTNNKNDKEMELMQAQLDYYNQQKTKNDT